MSISAHAQVQALLVAALNQSPALASGRVYTNPVREVPQNATTAITVTVERSEGQNPTLHAIDWRTTYRVECLASTTTSGADPAAAVDQLLQDTWQRLSQVPAGTAGLMQIGLDPAIVWDFAPGLTPLVSASIRVIAYHRTTPTSLSPWT